MIWNTCPIHVQGFNEGPVQVTTGINLGPDPLAQYDLKLMVLDQASRHARESEERRKQDKQLIDSGMVSALDLEAPHNAVVEYNRATSLMKAQNSKEAIKHFQRAIQTYPNFVLAHIGLGLAYVDQEDAADARTEFERAGKLDKKFAGAFLNLGLLALSMYDFETAEPELEKAASLCPTDARILSGLAYAQNGAHQYQQAVISSHGRMVNDLRQSDIRILDDNKPPEKVEQFRPSVEASLTTGSACGYERVRA